MDACGVLLQASYRIFAGKPVVHLFGRLDNGETFLVRDFRQRPHFYIAGNTVDKAQHITRSELVPGWTDFAGQPVARVDVPTPPDAPRVRDSLQARQINTYEADVRFAYRYLIDRGVKGSLRISGPAVPMDGVDWCFDDPEITPAEVVVEPRVLSFDIETDPRRDRLLAISLYAGEGGSGLSSVLVVDPDGREMPSGAIGLSSEAAVLRAFIQQIQDYDPDILTGWNCIDFDLNFLDKVAKRTKVPFEFGRIAGGLRIRPAQGYFGSGNATVPGRIVLDGIDLLRGAFVKMDEYSLDAVGREVLGEGKELKGDVKDRVGEILHMYAFDLDAFCGYALADSRMVLDILERLDLIRLAFARSRLTGMMPDRVAASIASFDFLYLTELQKRQRVAPTVNAENHRGHEPQAGGQVFEPSTGLHRNVWVFDFKSLYPSIIRTFNIDPLGYRDLTVHRKLTPEQVIALGDAGFDREPAVLPGLLNELFPQRQQAKERGDEVASQAIKILMNSMYGVLGTPACRFYNPAIANAITGQGRHLLRWMRSWFQQQGYDVLYGDTDSLFVLADESEVASERGPALAVAANESLCAYVAERWQVESALDLEFEKLYHQLFLPSVRGGSAGARKRYVGVKANGELEFVGLEVVRRDWTDLAKQVQRQAYASLFAGEEVAEYLQQTVTQLRAGEHDDLLVYRKGLRRPLDSYTSNTPPHVAAARKSNNPPSRLIAYVMTKAGPEPLDNLTAELDREHYVQKQLRPVVEPVLDTLGLRFDQVVGDDKQMGLF